MFPEEIPWPSSSSSYKTLERILDDIEKLDEEKTDIFHSIVVNLICSIHRASPDAL